MGRYYTSILNATKNQGFDGNWKSELDVDITSIIDENKWSIDDKIFLLGEHEPVMYNRKCRYSYSWWTPVCTCGCDGRWPTDEEHTDTTE